MSDREAVLRQMLVDHGGQDLDRTTEDMLRVLIASYDAGIKQTCRLHDAIKYAREERDDLTAERDEARKLAIEACDIAGEIAARLNGTLPAPVYSNRRLVYIRDQLAADSPARGGEVCPPPETSAPVSTSTSGQLSDEIVDKLVAALTTCLDAIEDFNKERLKWPLNRMERSGLATMRALAEANRCTCAVHDSARNPEQGIDCPRHG